ncbi:MAG: alpha-amylase family glycosyl hydrolase [Sedimentisphaerales bacterium]|jgi:1,4-alpha-glucan branching enzyme|nr:alpha-amylase family glycosyl hydrolase [Sedimentisphaerales bacterium]
MERKTRVKGAVAYEGGARFGVWAPHAGQVYVVGTFNDWDNTGHRLTRQRGGWWSGDVAGAKVGDEYRFRIVSDAGERLKIDPYARNVTSSVGNAIVMVAAKGFRPFTPPMPSEMVIYELHIGTFGKHGQSGPGNLEGALERLDHLKELGVNAIEVMPLSEFPGGYSWGYNPSHIFAVESDYGTPASFRDFVARAHELGIAVIVDVVYNHLGPDDLCLWQFDGWSENDGGGIYFYNDERAETPWGHTRPDFGRGDVREYLRDNALMWIRDYGVDGLRFDATNYIRNVRGHRGPEGDLPDGWSLMQWINQEIHKVRPDALTIAEDMQDDAALVAAHQDGGAGFNTQWDGRFVHEVRQALLAADDAARNLHAVRDAIVHRFGHDAFARVIYTESHDEVANGKARIPEELAPDHAATWIAKKRSTLGAALVFTAPGIPMIFQGQEFLEDDWFRDDDPIDWSKKERFAGIFRLYKDLIRLRLNRTGHTRGLCGQNADVFHVNQDQKVLAYHRWDRGGPGDSVVVAANFSAEPRHDYRIGLPAAGHWSVRFNSDGKAYDQEFGDMGSPAVTAEPQGYDGQPASGTIALAAYSAILLSQ